MLNGKISFRRLWLRVMNEFVIKAGLVRSLKGSLLLINSHCVKGKMTFHVLCLYSVSETHNKSPETLDKSLICTVQSCTCNFSVASQTILQFRRILSFNDAAFQRFRLFWKNVCSEFCFVVDFLFYILMFIFTPPPLYPDSLWILVLFMKQIFGVSNTELLFLSLNDEFGGRKLGRCYNGQNLTQFDFPCVGPSTSRSFLDDRRRSVGDDQGFVSQGKAWCGWSL